VEGIIVGTWRTAKTTVNDRSEFDAFVKRQQQSAADSKVDWSLELKDWLLHLNELYEKLEVLLRDYIEASEISTRYRETPMNEENVGAYLAREMTLKIGPQEIILKPVGMRLIGSKGRVDVVGPSGRTRFVLVSKDASRPDIRLSALVGSEWTWKIATSPPTVKYVELTQESLFHALMEVVNG
jgi:hypothetical protein